MRKRNKVLMIIVSILLCLTLISSCVLSNIFAKYTTKSERSVVAKIEKFGVTVEAKVDPALIALNDSLSADADKVVSDDGTAASITLKNIQIAPGDDFSKAVHFKITGQPKVNVRVKIAMDLSYSVSKVAPDGFIVPEGVGGNTLNGDSPYYYVPIGFTFGAKDANGDYKNDYAAMPWRRLYHASLENEFYNGHKDLNSKGVISRMDVKVVKSTSSSLGYIYQDFLVDSKSKLATIAFHPKDASGNVNKNVSINEFDLGFMWPLNWTPADTGYTGADAIYCDYDEMSMYFSEEGSPPITIKYTVSVEQITTT